ncbi:IS1634 family transposase [Sinomonas cyclohexanicum]|uniref:IS1634 family transposase n=1 Tax=Sinomonas cyclohexanicum TaxID=322009 RepID=A0ABN6FNU9_SINCY|nr:IS1634 family transposase [Corynebacterium cyclohexanicum]BCT78047.1 IS1634 family transposase [Corynebacterium cyclohexanicum]BCT78319.1 IS1634 family transposase [Corynebacterium cyclohexanicum]
MQIAESVDGRRRIVAHVGSAHTEAELGLLVERARELLDDPGQGELDLGLAPAAPRTALIGPPGEPALFENPGTPVPGRSAVAPPRVVATASRVLFDTLAAVFDDLGFDALADEVFRDLVVARIVEPTSILDTARVLGDLGVRPASEKTMRRTLSRAHRGSYRDQIARACFEHAAASGDVSLCLYDVTTLYFEAEKEDGLRKVGYSKERRVDPQIVVGLLVDREGFPLEIGCYEGNRAEQTTIIPIVKQFQDRHGIGDMVVVADAGMLSAANLTALEEAGLRFIVGSRAVKAPLDLASHFRWHGDAFTDAQVIDTITPRTGRRSENNELLRAEPVWDPETHPGSWRAVWAYSAKRAVRDGKTLTLQEDRARAVIAGEKAARAPRFVKTSGDGHTLDEAALARARRLVGLKGYVTNIPAHLMPAGEVIASYHELWHVEQSFRMSKTDLAARPMFVRTRDAIEAHLTIVFTALAVSREAQTRTGLAIRNIVRQLRPLRSATVASNGTTQTIAPHIDPDRQAIIDALTTGKSQALSK